VTKTDYTTASDRTLFVCEGVFRRYNLCTAGVHYRQSFYE